METAFNLKNFIREQFLMEKFTESLASCPLRQTIKAIQKHYRQQSFYRKVRNGRIQYNHSTYTHKNLQRLEGQHVIVYPSRYKESLRVLEKDFLANKFICYAIVL